MNAALLGGESSGGSGGGGSYSSPRRVFNRRSDAIAYGSTYQKAAALIDLAEDGIGLPEEILDRSNYENAARFYFLFVRFDFLWSLNFFALIALNFFEKPLWCARYYESCNNRDYYFLGQLPYLTGAESLVYEGITLILLLVHTVFPISYEGVRLYWKNDVNKLKVLSLLILVADFIVYVLYISPVAFYSLPFRIAPYIRVVFFILYIRDLRDSIVILAGMLGTYLNVLALWLLFLLFSSWLAYVIFEDTEQGKTIFTSYTTTLYQMFVLFTTSNNPDVWIPAYKASRWSCLFFILYVLLGVYFVTNLILAVVYDSFKSQLVKQVSDKDRMRIRILGKAFNLIDNYVARTLLQPSVSGRIRDTDTSGYSRMKACPCNLAATYIGFVGIIKGITSNISRTLPKISSDDFQLIFNELDDSHNFEINLEEFADLCNAIALRFQKGDSLPWLEKFPTFYHSPFSKRLKASVKSSMFGNVIAFVLVLNLAAVVIETTLDIQNSSGQKFWQSVEFVFGWLYVLEMALKVYAYGFENYWRDGQNRFDFIITWVIVIGETATFMSPNGLTFLSNGEWIRYLLIARMLRLIRLLMHVQRYRAFVATFLTLIPSLMPYLGTIFCIMCMYCSLGVQIFGGVVNAGNPHLSSTDLSDSDYLLFNFNDYPSGMVTLFNLLVMGNWQVWMQSYVYLTRTAWTYAYFISFFLITVLLLLNLIIAFVLEAFFAEMELESSDKCAEANGQDNGGRDRRGTNYQRVGTKSRSQRVDMLLHHMLSSELDQCATPNP